MPAAERNAGYPAKPARKLAAPLPDGKLDMPVVAALSIVNFCDAVQGNVIWPLLPFAVQHWGCKPEETGIYVGVLASSFFLAQSIAMPVWGILGDRIGRRPCMIWGTLGTAISMCVFALSTNIPMAMASRFLTGVLSGNVAISKGYMGEITEGASAAKGFSYLSFVWGFGSIVAPSLGGYLADPVEQYPAVFGDSVFFKTYPYSLPSLVSVAIALVAFLTGYFALPETEAFVRAKEERDRAKLAATSAQAAGSDGTDADVEMVRLVGIREEDSDEDGSREEGDGATVDARSRAAAKPSSQRGKASAMASATAIKRSSSGSGGGRRRGSSTADRERSVLEEDAVVDTTPPPSGGEGARAVPTPSRAAAAAGPSSSSGGPSGLRDVLRDPVIMTAILCYNLLAVVQILFDELLSVFAETPQEQGGLGLHAHEIGRILIFQGVSQIVCQLTFVPTLVTTRGPVSCFRHTMWPQVALLLFPALGRLAGVPHLLWPCIAAAVAYKATLMTIAFTAISLAINNSSRGRALGATNGVAMSTASLIRAIGPTVGGSLYSASLHFSGLHEWKLHVTYLVQAVFALLACAVSYKLPQWVDKAPEKKPEGAGAAGAGSDATMTAGMGH